MDIGLWASILSVLISLKDFLLYLVEKLFSIFFKFSRKAFYFKDYAYKTTIYANGHAIITHSYTIKIINMEKFKQEGINKMLDISDSCAANAAMPSLNKMKKLKKSDRFCDYGFWYESTDNCMEMSKTKDGKEDKACLKKWTFDYNKNGQKDKNTIKMCYAFSIPKCFDLENGYSNSSTENKEFETCFEISNPTFNFSFEIMIDDAIAIDNHSLKAYIASDTHNCMTSKRDLHFNNNKNELGTETYKTLFYKRYCVHKKFPKFRNRYTFKWSALNKTVDND